MCAWSGLKSAAFFQRLPIKFQQFLMYFFSCIGCTLIKLTKSNTLSVQTKQLPSWGYAFPTHSINPPPTSLPILAGSIIQPRINTAQASIQASGNLWAVEANGGTVHGHQLHAQQHGCWKCQQQNTKRCLGLGEPSFDLTANMFDWLREQSTPLSMTQSF